MRRFLKLTALLSTALALIATSRSPEPCAVETVSLAVESTCGAPGVVEATSARDCSVRLAGGLDAGLPGGGLLWSPRPDAGVLSGFSLNGVRGDGALTSCSTLPADGGLDLRCSANCDADGGGACLDTCTGRLSPVP